MKNQRRGGFCYYHYTTFIVAVKIPFRKLRNQYCFIVIFSLNSPLHLKPIPHPPDRFNILRLRRIVLYLFPDLLDVDGDGGYVSYGFHVPDLIEQLFLCVDMVWILGEEGQQVELLGGKCLFLSIDPDSSGGAVYLQAAYLNYLVGRATASYQPLISCFQ